MYYLGLDPSLTSYGWCVYDSEATGLDKVVAFGRWKTTSKMLEPVRYMSHRKSLTEVIRKYNITKSAIETPPVGDNGAFSQEKLYALYMVNMEVMFTEKVDVLLLAPLQLSLLAKVWGRRVVRGDWDKKDMIRTAYYAMLDLFTYPEHINYWDVSRTKRHRFRDNGRKKNHFPVVDLAEFSKEQRKRMKMNGDEADAFHCSKAACRFWSYLDGGLKEAKLTPSEWDVFAEQHTFTRGTKKGKTEYTGIKFKEDKRFFRFTTKHKSGMFEKTA